ncbi:MAG: hypothetical protein PUC93_04055, partial [Oscillospiraceae bacterium]|nr:hypothetical protein [Oscillospiraceae bacterium]
QNQKIKKSKNQKIKKSKNQKIKKRSVRRTDLSSCPQGHNARVFGKEDSYERNPGGVSFVLD